MASSKVSSSIKNGIIFVLLILIVHFTAKNIIEKGSPPAPPGGAVREGHGGCPLPSPIFAPLRRG